MSERDESNRAPTLLAQSSEPGQITSIVGGRRADDAADELGNATTPGVPADEPATVLDGGGRIATKRKPSRPPTKPLPPLGPPAPIPTTIG
jgi:hypothetical protein